MRLAGTGVIAALALACASSEDSAESPEIVVSLQTDRSAYTAVYLNGAGARARYGFAVNASFENSGNVPVYIARCTPTSPRPSYHVIPADASPGASSAFAPDLRCGAHDEQLEVPAGESRKDELFLVGPNAWTDSGAVRGSLTGRMQLAYHVQTCRGAAKCALPGTVTSSPFTVTIGELTPP